MKDCRPYSDPCHKLWIQIHVISLYYIEYSVIEQRYQSRDADDGQGLCANGTENDACESGGEEGFIDAVEATGAAVHVQDEG